jgi:catechol 2,3-dioxygenase-like lactoylglutathione lyase family enzyme
MLDHIGIRVTDLNASKRFYQSALAPLGMSMLGGSDNGAPGLRPDYHPDYYGAFVCDPDGHNIEVVKHAPE